jgi:transposase InsO family protein
MTSVWPTGAAMVVIRRTTVTTDDDDPRRQRALVRYQVISAYLALDPPRGKRAALRTQLAQKTWTDERGQPFCVAAETIRAWIRRYRAGGLEALADKHRVRRGCQALTAEQIELLRDLKREVPKRSVRRIIRIAEQMKLVPPETLRRSTVHRVLARAGISRQPPGDADRTDLDRFEADFANELWQSDLLAGPWLPDPRRPGKMRRAHLYAFIDDHSRLLLHGRFSFKGDLPALELVMRRCFQRWGKPRKVYYDNALVYRSRHMKQIVAELGLHPIIFTKRYRPMGHGKVEALNRLIRSEFRSADSFGTLAG